MKTNACIFCQILAGQKRQFVYEDEQTVAFLDIRPASKQGGHTLVIPKKHYELLSNVPDAELYAVSSTVKKITKALLKFGEGVNVLQNNKLAAGQVVNHVHFHVIPRFSKDGINFAAPVNEYPEGKLEELTEQIRRLL